MIKHIVMFQMKTSFVPKEKLEKSEKLKEALDALPAKIPEIEFFEVGTNFSDSPRAFDLVLISHFKSLKELDTYRVHPDHKKVLAFIKENTEKTVVVDYQD